MARRVALLTRRKELGVESPCHAPLCLQLPPPPLLPFIALHTHLPAPSAPLSLGSGLEAIRRFFYTNAGAPSGSRIILDIKRAGPKTPKSSFFLVGTYSDRA